MKNENFVYIALFILLFVSGMNTMLSYRTFNKVTSEQVATSTRVIVDAVDASGTKRTIQLEDVLQSIFQGQRMTNIAVYNEAEHTRCDVASGTFTGIQLDNNGTITAQPVCKK